MTVRMTGFRENDGSITCRLASSILEECIDLPPDQLKIMIKNEESRQKGDSIVTEGAKTVLGRLKPLLLCTFVLYKTAVEFFHSSSSSYTESTVDGDEPVLLLMSCDTF